MQTDLHVHDVASGGRVAFVSRVVVRYFCPCAGASDVIAQTDLCNHGNASGVHLICLVARCSNISGVHTGAIASPMQTDLHRGNTQGGVLAHCPFWNRHQIHVADVKENLMKLLNLRAQRDREKTVVKELRVPLPDGSIVRLPSMPLIPLSDM